MNCNEMKCTEIPIILFVSTSLLLVSNALLSLRASFLPFARFVTGVTWVMTNLIPFFVACTFFIMSFTYWYRVDYSLRNRDEVIDEGELIDLNCGKNGAFDSCSFTILSFFISGNGKTLCSIFKCN